MTVLYTRNVGAKQTGTLFHISLRELLRFAYLPYAFADEHCVLERERASPAPVIVSNFVLYCLSYTAVLFTFVPFASVAVVVAVRLLPSGETTIRPERVTLPSFVAVNVSV
jgi:hypothetical protein